MKTALLGYLRRWRSFFSRDALALKFAQENSPAPASFATENLLRLSLGARLLQVVDFHQGDAGAELIPAHNRRVITGDERANNR